MKKKLMLFVVGCAVLMILAYYVPKWIENEVQRRLDLVEVVCAKQNIEPRTVIDSEDLDVMLVPSVYVSDKAYLSAEEVIGLLTTQKSMIYKGSLFYYDALVEKKDASDGVLLDLKEDQVLFAVQTNLIQMGANALLPSQVVDVYVTLETDQRERVFSELLRGVRILGVKDHQGLDLDDPKSSGVPHVLQLAISKEALPVLTKAINEGEISYYASSKAYSAADECSVVWESSAIELLKIE